MGCYVFFPAIHSWLLYKFANFVDFSVFATSAYVAEMLGQFSEKRVEGKLFRFPCAAHFSGFCRFPDRDSFARPWVNFYKFLWNFSKVVEMIGQLGEKRDGRKLFRCLLVALHPRVCCFQVRFFSGNALHPFVSICAKFAVFAEMTGQLREKRVGRNVCSLPPRSPPS